MMKHLMRRSLVAVALSTGVVTAGAFGLAHANAATTSGNASTAKPSTSATATHHCDGDGKDGSSDSSSSS